MAQDISTPRPSILRLSGFVAGRRNITAAVVTSAESARSSLERVWSLALSAIRLVFENHRKLEPTHLFLEGQFCYAIFDEAVTVANNAVPIISQKDFCY